MMMMIMVMGICMGTCNDDDDVGYIHVYRMMMMMMVVGMCMCTG